MDRSAVPKTAGMRRNPADAPRLRVSLRQLEAAGIEIDTDKLSIDGRIQRWKTTDSRGGRTTSNSSLMLSTKAA